ncbi:Peroxisome biogenesis protein 12 [Diplonema papillatum]|nr:Peroxisome biogenesis protein 12 [Diplonema papillatum]
MDLILSQFNVDSPLPTFFEMRAQEELMPVLSGAFRYALTVSAQRVIQLAPMIKYSDEVFTAVWALLDYKFLSAIDSTFSENFYGLKRVVAPPNADIMKDIEDGKLHTYNPLTKRDRVLSTIFSALVPYLKQKLSSVYTDLKEASSASSTPPSKATRAFLKLYPWLHFVLEMTTFVYWLRYLFMWPWWSAFLHSRRVVLRRLEMADQIALQNSRHAPMLERAGHILLWTVVCFRVLEWWNSTEQVRESPDNGTSTSGASGSRKVPPPPRPSQLDDASLATLDDSACPLCKHSITNPTLVAPSGVVYCYPCIHQYVDSHKEDPVTKLPCTLDHLRRIYETT